MNWPPSAMCPFGHQTSPSLPPNSWWSQNHTMWQHTITAPPKRWNPQLTLHLKTNSSAAQAANSGTTIVPDPIPTHLPPEGRDYVWCAQLPYLEWQPPSCTRVPQWVDNDDLWGWISAPMGGDGGHPFQPLSSWRTSGYGTPHQGLIIYIHTVISKNFKNSVYIIVKFYTQKLANKILLKNLLSESCK